MAKNYYITLGIGRGADINQIKKAYRTIAKRSHPDATQTKDAEHFREVKEAYEILSDAESRRKHDAELEKMFTPTPVASAVTQMKRRASALDEMQRFRSFADEFFDGFLPGLYRKPRYRGPKKDLYYEIVLSPDEAFHGGLFPIKVPVIERCPFCIQNQGFWQGFSCLECNDYGFIRSEREFSLSIPPQTPNNTEVMLSLEDIGMDDVNLYLHVRVDPYLDEQF